MLLKKLCNIYGVSGYEENIQKFIKSKIEKITDEVKVDRMGNIIAFKKSKKINQQSRNIKVMIAAHMDEIGFMVKYIDNNGFLRFETIGKFDPRTLVAQKVIIQGKKNIEGVISLTGILNKENKKVEMENLFIDTGLRKKEIAKYVSIGDIVCLKQKFEKFNENIVAARNFDDRIGIYIMLEALKKLNDYFVDIYAVGTVQEELGVRGSTVASFNIKPDIGIAIDGSLASNIPGLKDENKHCLLGEGTGIYIMDKLTIYNKGIIDFFIKLAKENKIKYQMNIGGGTDASAIQRSRKGALVSTIGAPVKYMHTPVQLAHIEDIENSVELLKVFLENVHKFSL